jgi:hypothetical protein
VTTDRLSIPQLEELAESWTARLERELEHATFSVDELTLLAERQRAVAQVTDSPGQRRALLVGAERFEQAACDRAAVRR